MERYFLLMVLSSTVEVNRIWTCEDRNKCETSKNRFIPLCYCDNRCFLYRDCCKEFYEAGGGSTHSGPPLSPPETCQILTNQKHADTERIGAFMVDRCTDTDAQCNATIGDLSTMIPVSAEGTTYRNADCALCNNVTKFTYWNIAFSVSPEYEKNLKTSQPTSDEAVLNEIKNEVFSEGIHYLHPPKGITPRFCVYDVQKRRDTIDDRLNYQNTFFCNNTLFKNKEECLEDGCCINTRGFCIWYYLQFFTDTDNTRSQINNGLHLVIEFKPTMTEADFVVQEVKMSVEKVTFNDIEVYITIELAEESRGTLSLDDCIYSIINYLGTTAYQLFPESPHLSTIWIKEEDKEIFFLIFRSYAKLTLSQLTDLLQLKYHLQCEETHDNVTFYAYGILKTSSEYENNELFGSKVNSRRIMHLQRFRIPPNTVDVLCSNLSFAPVRSNSWEIPVGVRCLDKEIYVEAESNNCSNLNINVHSWAAFLVFLFASDL